MPTDRPPVDPDGLLEYSVVFNDRSLNHMSAAFRQVMRDISTELRGVYAASSVAVVPGGGTCAMEAVARQFATGRRCVVIRNGWFSYRWSQILEAGDIPATCEVLSARQAADERAAPFAPIPIDEAVERIRAAKPDVVFAPHVETSAGLLLPDDYITALATAAHDAGALLVLDCIASGAAWVHMARTGVDVLITAPQKGWSGSPCAGLVMFSDAAASALEHTASSSFALDLRKWRAIMRAYEDGGHAYHATLPTDGLRVFRDAMHDTREFGYATARERQFELGRRVRAMLAGHRCPSVAAEGFEAPGVVVCHTDDAKLHDGSRLAGAGVQIAAGVPLMCGERDDYQSFRIGLFGLDKLADVAGTVARLDEAFTQATRSP